MLRLYMDVHVDFAITAGLRLRQVDVLTAQEDGTTRLDDEPFLDRAASLNRVLFTQDEDFLTIAGER
jgi:predicted nuclease of predicted toxin-antitoxin system